MNSLLCKWYKDVANIYEAYSLFYDRNPNFGVRYWEDQERIKVEFQTMVYLIEYGLEIVLGDGEYPTYQFNDRLNDSTPQSKRLEETIDFLISSKNPEEYIKRNMCTLDDAKKELIKRYGRLFCIKVGNPSSIDILSWMARHYYLAHTAVGISKYSVMREEERYKFKGSLQTLAESISSEQCTFSHSFSEIEFPGTGDTFLDDYCSETNGFIGDGDRESLPSYEYLKKANHYRMNAIGLADPFIHYLKNVPPFNVNWDKACKQLAKEENYEEEWDMILGSSGESNTLKKADVQEK